jgi:hypothetical protein
MNKPTFIAYIVTESKGHEQKAIWHKVGAVFSHKNGEGFDLVIPAGMSVSGRIVCVPSKEE